MQRAMMGGARLREIPTEDILKGVPRMSLSTLLLRTHPSLHAAVLERGAHDMRACNSCAWFRMPQHLLLNQRAEAGKPASGHIVITSAVSSYMCADKHGSDSHTMSS
jgi:hypothetical protein